MGTELTQHEQDLRKIEEFRLLDDEFMTAVFNGATEEVSYILTVILGFKVTAIDVRTQYELKNLKGRSARLDIYAKDEKGKFFDVEIQRADKGAGYRRARFNSSMVDSNLLKAGTRDYSLPDVYIIFITENDVMGEGLGVYHVERVIKELNKPFEDGEHIIYVNGQFVSDNALGKLMHDFRCRKASEIYNPLLAEKVRYFKETEEGVSAMCKMMEDMRNETALATAKKIAEKLLRTTELSDKLIADNVDLPETQIAELRKSLQMVQSV